MIPTDLGDGTTDLPVKVVGTVVGGWAWSAQLPEGWTRTESPAIVNYSFVLDGRVRAGWSTPIEPSVTQAVCTGGVVTTPTLTLAATDGITYMTDADPPYRPGQSVVVTATLDAKGVGWPAELPEGWTETSDTVARFTVEFDAVECTPVSPVAPTVTQATCTAGAVTAPTISVGNTTGIVYEVAPTGPYDGAATTEVIVRAILANGYSLGQLPDRWEELGPGRARFVVVLTGASCRVVAPVAPALTQAKCAGGVVTTPTLTLATTDGITYAAAPQGPYTQGQSVAVTATLDATGCRLA